MSCGILPCGALLVAAVAVGAVSIASRALVISRGNIAVAGGNSDVVTTGSFCHCIFLLF